MVLLPDLVLSQSAGYLARGEVIRAKTPAWLIGALLGSIAIMLFACGEPSPGNDPSSGSSQSSPTPTGLANWPDVDSGGEACVVRYPHDLGKLENAFDGTIEAVEFGNYNEDAGATPVRLEFRVNEVFRGQHIDNFVVMNTWDFMLPNEDVTGTRLLAAAGPSLDLMGCGFTRPYSEDDASRWRKTFSLAGPEDCGKEVRDCSLGEPSSIPATCERDSLTFAIAANIDQGSYPFDVLGCDQRFVSLRLDLGADACPPEATKEQRKECARKKTAYFIERDGTWELITYESHTRCDIVQELVPSFPDDFCRPD